MKQNSAFVIFISSLFLFMSCDQNRYYDKIYNFENESWHKDSALIFDIEVLDSTQVFNIFISNRTTGQYKYSNLYLFVNTMLPNNETLRDTLECVLADPSGKWLGKGFGNVWSNKINFRRNVRFPYTGNYTITIEQAMRDDELEHILDAGVRVETVN